jgi:hypothetical protein
VTWTTLADLVAARERFEAAIPGWQRPQAYGLVRRTGDRIEVLHVEIGAHPLPTVVLATVCGYAHGTAVYDLDPATFERAIELLSPAEACTEVDHPNLWKWQALRREGVTPVVVFIEDLSRTYDDPAVEAVRLAAGS